MMPDKIYIKAPAKINLFLRILSIRKDGYHNIRTGVTFINLYDEIVIKKNNLMKITYKGPFKPKNELYSDCIIKKTLNFLNLRDKINLEIVIKKNIPTQAGLGSSSTNAAALIKGLSRLNIISNKYSFKFYSNLGADIPVCLFGKNALVTGIGEKIASCEFKKYYFLIVKPKTNFLTKEMYNKINNIFLNDNYNRKPTEKIDNDLIYGNDFQKVAKKNSNEIRVLLEFLSKSNGCIFSRLTGSGSCCYAAYSKIDFANIAKNRLKEKFSDLWSVVAENNTINN